MQENHKNQENQATNEEQKNSEQEIKTDELENCKSQIEEMEKTISSLNDKILRFAADLDNTRRRAREELEKTAKFAISGFVSDLVLVVENFFLATENAPKDEIEKNPAIKHFADAISMTKNEMMKILEKNQVKRIFPLNEKFDHNFHEAVSRVESDLEEGMIVQVLQAGYVISDRLIRPALVAVSTGQKKDEENS